jgi:phosphatidate cytidylyltransferase
MLKARVATAAAGLPVLVGFMAVGGWPWTILVTATVSLAAIEYYRAAGIPALGASVGLLLVAAQVISAASSEDWQRIALIAAVVVPSLWPVLTGRPRTALADWSLVVLGILYYGWLGSYAILIRDLPEGRGWLFLAVSAAFATDTGAYFFGRALGRHRLAPLISPRKTWEGAAAGWACGSVTVLALDALLGLPASRGDMLVAAAAFPVAAELGDLVKSAIKRSLGVKDFGRILPGHGGMADRIDSMLFAIPLLYLWLEWNLSP